MAQYGSAFNKPTVGLGEEWTPKQESLTTPQKIWLRGHSTFFDRNKVIIPGRYETPRSGSLIVSKSFDGIRIDHENDHIIFTRENDIPPKNLNNGEIRILHLLKYYRKPLNTDRLKQLIVKKITLKVGVLSHRYYQPISKYNAIPQIFKDGKSLQYSDGSNIDHHLLINFDDDMFIVDVDKKQLAARAATGQYQKVILNDLDIQDAGYLLEQLETAQIYNHE